MQGFLVSGCWIFSKICSVFTKTSGKRKQSIPAKASPTGLYPRIAGDYSKRPYLRRARLGLIRNKNIFILLKNSYEFKICSEARISEVCPLWILKGTFELPPMFCNRCYSIKPQTAQAHFRLYQITGTWLFTRDERKGGVPPLRFAHYPRTRVLKI